MKMPIILLLFIHCFCCVAVAAEKEKALTNADILDLIKAGLPESTIVQKIQASETAFDTSPKALVDLKNQGVGASIMEAMIKPRAAQPISPPPTERRIIDYETVVLIDGTNRTPMKPVMPVGWHESGSFAIPGPFGGTIGNTDNVTESQFDGPCAVVRSTSAQPVLEVNLHSTLRSVDVLSLVKPKVKPDRRLLETYRTGTFTDPVKARKKDYVPMTFDETTWTNSHGIVITICRAKPSAPLAPGEYFFMNSGTCYDFGVGGNGVSVAVSMKAPTAATNIITDPAVERLCESLNQDDPGRVKDALKKLSKMPQATEAVPRILPCLSDSKPDVVREACRTLAIIGNQSAVPALLPLLTHDRPDVVREACRTLAIVGNKNVIPSLEPLLTNSRSDIREEAYKAITKLRAKQADAT
jgi:hypothetical protein